jgi:hypothetical protein
MSWALGTLHAMYLFPVGSPHKHSWFSAVLPQSAKRHAQNSRTNMIHGMMVPSLQLAALGTVQYIEARNSSGRIVPHLGLQTLRFPSHTVSQDITNWHLAASASPAVPNLVSLPYPLIRSFIYEYTFSSVPHAHPSKYFFNYLSK